MNNLENEIEVLLSKSNNREMLLEKLELRLTEEDKQKIDALHRMYSTDSDPKNLSIKFDEFSKMLKNEMSDEFHSNFLKDISEFVEKNVNFLE